MQLSSREPTPRTGGGSEPPFAQRGVPAGPRVHPFEFERIETASRGGAGGVLAVYTVPQGGGQLQVRKYPDMVFRVGVVGTLLVQHQTHLVTMLGLGAHPPLQGEFESFWMSPKKSCHTPFEGDADMILRIEDHGYFRTHRLMAAPPQPFYGCS